MSSLFDDVKGQTAAVAALKRTLANDRVAHGYLFEGPSGVGKERAAIALACALLCPDAPKVGCGVCHTCQRVREGKHPDVRVFRPRDEGHRNIQVETVRDEILQFTKFAPFEASAAVLIFPEADVSFPVVHAEAANALLKTLEEPRPQITFVLLSERPDRLLPTIRSRCQTVRFAALGAELLREILAQHAVPEEARDSAIALARGRADRALLLAEEGRAERLLELALRIDEAASSRRAGAIIDAADELAGSDEREILLDTLALFYRDICNAALLGDAAPLSFPHRAELVRKRAETLGASGAASRVQAIEATVDALTRNAQPELAMDAMLFGF
ncbi:MAG TPA: DNA polymerase III subunit delta' [Polyangiales bacterium]|nr:DNA polymerase III subunit delta' [Polyangiales bacterium]